MCRSIKEQYKVYSIAWFRNSLTLYSTAIDIDILVLVYMWLPAQFIINCYSKKCDFRHNFNDNIIYHEFPI